MTNKHSINDLYQMQALSLASKIQMSKARIRAWIEKYGEDGVYVSFSGGKDSTVLLDLVRSEYPNVKAVFVDTGLEYPEIRAFVKTFDNVEILKPKKNFKQVIQVYGYPFFSKENAQKIYEIKHTGSEILKHNRLHGDSKGNGKLPDLYKFMLDPEAPEVSHLCCNIMKKSPVKSYEHKTGRKPIVATMATESRNRTVEWLRTGCNSFDSKRPISKPMSFWSEQDVLMYIAIKRLPICSVYGVIADDTECEVSPVDLNPHAMIFDKVNPVLHTTKCDRTGCMYCGFGCHLNEDQRFLRIKETHPKVYEYIMKSVDSGGLGYEEIIKWINNHSDFNIMF
jgi:3'-phosphoadenosine 5'-phosphosulfate sulfotransferase (PAPS reductase)/FAD synthetase